MPYNANQLEQEILDFWNTHRIFEKSINDRPKDRPYVFYDGPPFATGLPHYGHIVAGTIKDAMPRYQTMRGYRVERRWGWDCHGLPIENIVEKELNLPGKKEIEAYGIDRFNEACRARVLTYADEWQKIMPRLGRWVDMARAYRTMDPDYMESVWWVFAELWKKGLVYEGKKAMHICPRCATPLSNFEVTQGYKDVKDLSVIVKFTIDSAPFAIEGRLSLLAWTTTPWTLPGNVLLAVGDKIVYVLVKHENEHFIVAKERLIDIFAEKDYQVVREVCSSDLVGLTYEPLFPYFTNLDGIKKAFRVVLADFVKTEEGTGIVHIAPAFGDDDYQIFKQEGVPFIQHVTIDGRFTAEVTDFAEMEVKPKDDHMSTDIAIVRWLAHHGRLFAKKKYEHSYPHCWRCETPLLNYATSSWFVDVPALKDELVKQNDLVTWVPEHIKKGRFGKWLEGAREWAVSRSRYWGTPLPVWRCVNDENGCNNLVVVGSIAQLEKISGAKITDLHKHFVDIIYFPCEKCNGQMKRVPEVFDCWFESGAMPYGQAHYPFSSKEKFETSFPADFIAEGADQTRGWFYTLHVLAIALTSGPHPSIPTKTPTSAFKNVVVNGIVLDEDGKKMSKHLRNYPDPMSIVETYGADALRLYLLNSPVGEAESLNFSETGVREVYNKVCNTLWNVVTFYKMFAENQLPPTVNHQSSNVLDRWILAKLGILVNDVTNGMEAYKFAKASRPIQDFVLDLSQWYVRRSRDRFKHGSEEDRRAALATFRHVLLTTSKVMAPFAPFLAEHVWQTVSSDTTKSVHLESWPEADEKMRDDRLISEMDLVRKMVEMGLSLRKEAGIRVRQPLSKGSISNFHSLNEQLQKLVLEELNIKEMVVLPENDHWIVKEEGGLQVAFDIVVTPELEQDGLVREVVRAINQSRKDQGLTRESRVVVEYGTDDIKLRRVFSERSEEIKIQVLADDVREGVGGETLLVNEAKISINITKV